MDHYDGSDQAHPNDPREKSCARKLTSYGKNWCGATQTKLLIRVKTFTAQINSSVSVKKIENKFKSAFCLAKDFYLQNAVSLLGNICVPFFSLFTSKAQNISLISADFFRNVLLCYMG